GATAIGARPFLVAFNIYLDSSDVAIAKEIAKQIRTSSGGLPAVQASGFEVAGQAQVSMNLLDIDTTSPAAVFAAVAREARARAGGLVAMVARLTTGRKAYAAVQGRVAEIVAEADALRAQLRRLVDDDAAAYARVSAAYKLPKDAPGRRRAVDEALVGAARTPLAMARGAARLAALAGEIGAI